MDPAAPVGIALMRSLKLPPSHRFGGPPKPLAEAGRRTAVALAEAGQGWPAADCRPKGLRDTTPRSISQRALSACLGAGILLLLLQAPPVAAADRYAVVISGASAGSGYALKYDLWRTSFVAALKERFRFPDDHVFVLGEADGPNVIRSTRANVQRVFAGLQTRVTGGDIVFVLLIGHGTAADDDAKFNLVGPDLSSTEWAALLKPLRGPVVFVNTTGGSFPFLRRLSGSGRVIVTATDSSAQQFETTFPQFFIQAFDESAADVDKNGRVSVWEAFNFASTAVRRSFDQRGELPTERALLDDNGDGTGREAQNPGPDGTLARSIYLAAESSAADGPEDLLKQRAELQRRLDDLRLRKASSTDPSRFDAEIEALILEIARISREIRPKP
jgi:hypothetical protein